MTFREHLVAAILMGNTKTVNENPASAAVLADAVAAACCHRWGHSLAENYRPSDVCGRCGITGRQVG